MSLAWGGFKNGRIPFLKMLKVEGEYFEPTTGKAMLAALAEIRAHGVHVGLNEGYRPLGIPADEHVTDAHKTSTGGSNQWFQYGRAKRGETPVAAYPGGSVHGWAKAADVENGANGVVRSVLAKYGFKFTIPSEPWHCEFVGVPTPPKPIAEPNALQLRSWKLLQCYLAKNWGYKGAIDGIAGAGTWSAVQRWLKARHGYAGIVDGIPGPQTYAALKSAGSNLR